MAAVFTTHRKATDYEFEQYIESGGVRSICRAHCKLSGKPVALKIYNKCELSMHSVGHRLSKEQVYREIRNHGKATGHLNVLSLYGAFEDRNAIVLVLEFCEGGDVLKEMRRVVPYPQQRALLIIGGLVSALAHLDANAIIHSDVKPENILICRSVDGDVVKLADFGLSLDASVDLPCQISGTLEYLAPEVASLLLGKLTSDDDVTSATRSTKADVWSCGVTAFEILTGTRLFCAQSSKKCIRKIMMGPKPDKIRALPRLQADFCSMALRVDAENRVSSHELLQHPMFSGQSEFRIENLLRTIERCKSLIPIGFGLRLCSVDRRMAG